MRFFALVAEQKGPDGLTVAYDWLGIAAACIGIIGGIAGLLAWVVRIVKRAIEDAVRHLGKPNGGDGLRDAVDQISGHLVLQDQALKEHGSILTNLGVRMGVIEADHAKGPT